MANDNQLKILRSGVDAWNAWRTANQAEAIDLEGANLERANLKGANLEDANYKGVRR